MNLLFILVTPVSGKYEEFLPLRHSLYADHFCQLLTALDGSINVAS